MYCVYNGKKYKIKKKNDKYIITSRVRKEDFINYIDVLGNEHSELFMKIVNANEVDIIYNEDILIKYIYSVISTFIYLQIKYLEMQCLLIHI